MFVLFVCLQLKKMSETTKHLPSPEFGPEWVETLCEVCAHVVYDTVLCSFVCVLVRVFPLNILND